MSYFPLFVLWNVRDIAEEYCSTCQQMKSVQKCQEICLPVGSRPFCHRFLGPSSSRAGNTLSRTASSSSPRPHWCSSHGQLGIRTFYSPISVMVSKRVGDSPHFPRQMSDAKMINATSGSRGFILPDDESWSESLLGVERKYGEQLESCLKRNPSIKPEGWIDDFTILK